MSKRKKKKSEELDTPTPLWIRECQGFALVALSILLLLSLASFHDSAAHRNWLGLFGAVTGGLLHYLLGLVSYPLALLSGWLGVRLIVGRQTRWCWRIIGYSLLAVISIAVLSNLIEDTIPTAKQIGGKLYANHHYHLGGNILHYLYHDVPYVSLRRIFNVTGTAIIFGSLLFLCILRITETSLAAATKMVWQWIWPPLPEAIEPEPEPILEPKFVGHEESEDEEGWFQKTMGWFQRQSKLEREVEEELREPLNLAPEPSTPPSPQFDMGEAPPQMEFDLNEHSPPPAPVARKSTPPKTPPETTVEEVDYSNYRVPSPSLLTHPKKVDQSAVKKGLRQQAQILEETLLSFGIEAKVGQINCGPTITSFEVHPAVGVKVQRIKALESDIALNLKARSLRIIAPIPGKAAVGIEIPNPQPQEVGFRELLTTYQKGAKKLNIPLLLGKAVNGDDVMADLAKMPHCIIAGATGSGKSVCINTIVMSILLNMRPDEVKLLMVDPKKVELTPYSRLPHMLAPVINEPHEACLALNWLVREMESRYDLLKQVGARNISGYNAIVSVKKDHELLERETGRTLPTHLPYIVGIIDELADLMMVSSSDIETPIARIAQMARAVGIHLILATQRPSREVITGLIKANFPTRISFKVASRINSQIVLDDTGAETLLGNGDMLFLPPGSSHLVRAQGAFIRDEDINKVVDTICGKNPPNYLIRSFEDLAGSGSAGEAVELDSLYDEAYNIVTSTGTASTTFIQRKLKVGYARAASIMDQLESQGIIAPQEGAKPRRVLVHQGGEDE